MEAVRISETSADFYSNRKTEATVNNERNSICAEEA
jgi:hypothetical protein